MALSVFAPKGTNDVLPSEVYKWQQVEKLIREVCRLYDFKEIRTPIFEHTEVFSRSVGDTSDVVTKEMYTFDDKGGRSITLRPEGTAGVVRAFLENGLFNEALPAKLFYIINCFRYEAPQKGRLRQFSQFGVEMMGATTPQCDADIISLPYNIFKRLGVKDITLFLNSIGCKDCRKEYHNALVSYFEKYYDLLCPTCKTRLKTNPMRILDCKCEECKKIAKDAPVVLDYICDDCKDHFNKVKECLDTMGIEYKINPYIVRGLDYYNKTVFEFVSENIGAKGTVCGGGRYDGLTCQMGADNYPGIGFAMGIERLLLLLDECGIKFENDTKPQVYIAPMGENASKFALKLVNELRQNDISCEFDLMNRSLKAQMKYANKIGAKKVIIIGDNEIESGKLVVKDMEKSCQDEVLVSKLINTLKGN